MNKYLCCRRFKIALYKKPLIMGIINVTPDSFSDGGKYFNTTAAVKRAFEIESQGADIIDIGAESTRPGSDYVSSSIEIKRLLPVLKRVLKKIRIPVSVDTTKPEVAEIALKLGASIINDTTGLRQDNCMADVIAEHNAAVIIMHANRSPKTMQKSPRYGNVIMEIKKSLVKSATKAVNSGINNKSIIIDPGIGFGKTLRHNFDIIKNINEFKKTGFPVLIGLSRKSFIGKMLNLDVTKRLIPTVACNAIAIKHGADILRVHDVREAVWTRDIVKNII